MAAGPYFFRLEAMRKNHIETAACSRRIIIMLISIACCSGLILVDSPILRAENNTPLPDFNEWTTVAQVGIRPQPFSGIIKPKGPSQKELREAAELAHKRRLETAEQSTRYVVETTDGGRIDCKTITRDEQELILTTQTGKTLNIKESEVKKISRFQYFNGRTNMTTVDRFSDIPEKNKAADE